MLNATTISTIAFLVQGAILFRWASISWIHVVKIVVIASPSCVSIFGIFCFDDKTPIVEAYCRVFVFSEEVRFSKSIQYGRLLHA